MRFRAPAVRSPSGRGRGQRRARDRGLRRQALGRHPEVSWRDAGDGRGAHHPFPPPRHRSRPGSAHALHPARPAAVFSGPGRLQVRSPSSRQHPRDTFTPLLSHFTPAHDCTLLLCLTRMRMLCTVVSVPLLISGQHKEEGPALRVGDSSRALNLPNTGRLRTPCPARSGLVYPPLSRS